MVNLKKDGVMKLLRTTLIIVDKFWHILKVLHTGIHAWHTRAYSQFLQKQGSGKRMAECRVTRETTNKVRLYLDKTQFLLELATNG